MPEATKPIGLLHPESLSVPLRRGTRCVRTDCRAQSAARGVARATEEQAMVDKSEKFRLLVRLGYAARGLVYVLLGYLALSASGDAAAGPEASFDMLQDVPLGAAVLYVAAVGLLAYAIYKLIAAVA